MNTDNRENFGSRFAVIMAMAGSAIGLGNIWRFPYIVGEMGGGAFVLIYVLATLLISAPLFMTEAIIGRRSKLSAANAMYALSKRKKFWKGVGLVLVASPLIILSYYSVVGGWAVDFLIKSLNFTFSSETPDHVSTLFGGLISSTWRPIIAHLFFMGTTAVVVSMGVKSGIEKFNKFTVPVLFGMIIFIMIYSLFLPGSDAGVKYLLKFDASSLTPKTLAYALGQSFYSLSLGMGTIITYGSYIRKQENLLTSGITVAVSDLMFAILAAFAIMPAVFAAGLEPGAGPGLIFQTIPYIFSTMSTELPVISDIIAIVFFLAIFVAALTSSVSLMEVGAAYIVENTGMSRKKATTILFVILGTIGTLCSLSFGPLADFQIAGKGLFDLMDWFSSNVVLILASLLATVFAGWFMRRESFTDEFSSGGKYSLNKKIGPVLHIIIKYAAPLAIFAIFITNFIL